MAVSNFHILQQGPVLGALARGALVALRRSRGVGTAPVDPPGPEFRETIPPRPKALVRDYIRHVGGDPASYRDTVPPHLFPQWVFPLQARTLEGVSYPMQRVLNGGCRIEINAPLPADSPLDVRCHLADIDDNGRRAVLHQVAVTGTQECPDALVSHMYAIVPLGKRDGEKRGGERERARVPSDAREIAFLRVRPSDALDFAKLTGDFNPVHWVPPYARMMGFKNVILHGFSTMARAIEALNRNYLAGDVNRLRSFDVRFTKPLVLPAQVGVYVHGDDGIYVGDAPGGSAYLKGTFAVRERSWS